MKFVSKIFHLNKETASFKIDRTFKIYFIAYYESKRFQLQFATNRIKIGPLEPEIQPVKGCPTSLRWAYDVTWRHTPTAGNMSFVTIFISFWLWKYICKTHKKFQVLNYHTEVVRGEYLLYIAGPSASLLPTNTPLL